MLLTVWSQKEGDWLISKKISCIFYSRIEVYINYTVYVFARVGA